MMLHPPMAHFAIALPVVAAVFSLLYLFVRSEGMSKMSTRLLVVAAVAVIGAWYTGSQAGPDVYPLLSPGGQEELKEHKELGEYLAVAFGIIAVLKFAGCQMRKFGLEALAAVLLLIATAGIFVQGKHGGELVYEYGAGVEKYSDGMDCLDDPEMYLEEEDE